MSFFSLTFLVFIISLAVTYFLLPGKCQWPLLLIGSYVFYIWAGGWRALLFLAATTLTVFAGGVIMGRMADDFAAHKPEDRKEAKCLKAQVQRKKRAVMIVVLLINLFLLGAVKYASFVFEQLNALFSATGSGLSLPIPHLLLPLGISFYTFQSLGYLIDVYRGRVEADRNIFKFALFVSYFPQIVQGPISRYGQLAHQLYEPHSFDYDRVRSAIMRIMWGFFKKMVIADRIAVIVNEIFGHYADKNYTGFVVFTGVLLYSIQIYADFSAGMDITIGLSEGLGITQTENFNQPFMSKSVAEFWRRWHITLGDWMREYVFYPLALSKLFSRFGKWLRKHFGRYAGKVVPASIASLIVFLLVGIWHGASWNFVAYGLYQALFISTDSLFQDGYQKLNRLFHVKEDSFSWKLFQMLRTTLIVTFGRYLSRAAGLRDALSMLKHTFSECNPWIFFDDTLYNLGLSAENFRLMIILIILLFAVDILHERGFRIRRALIEHDIVIRWVFYFACLFGIIIFGMYGSSFDAGKFIYQGF